MTDFSLTGLCELATISETVNGVTYRWIEYVEILEQDGEIVGLQEVPKCGLAGAGLAIEESDS